MIYSGKLLFYILKQINNPIIPPRRDVGGQNMVTDPIADYLTRIRNAQMAQKADVAMPSSKMKASVAQVLKDEGYVESFAVVGEPTKPQLEVVLKYYAGRPVIERIERTLAVRAVYLAIRESASSPDQADRGIPRGGQAG